MAKETKTEKKMQELALQGLTLKIFGVKFLICPNEKQKIQINKTFGCTRFIANYYLHHRMELYKNEKKSTSQVGFKKQLTALKNEEKTIWLKEVDKFSLENAIMNVDDAYKRFFNKQGRFPKFKKKHDANSSYKTNFTNNNIEILADKRKVKLPKLQEVACKITEKQLEQCAEGTIKSATISRNAKGQYFVSLSIEKIVPLEEKKTFEIDDAVGIDLGLTHFAILSTGEKIENPRYYQKNLKKLKKLQKRLSKMVKGSANYKKQKQKIAKLHNHITNMRKDFLHKISRKIVNENQVIVLEDLNVKGMLKNKRLAKSIQDVGWGMFKTFLRYKANWANQLVLFVDRFFPSSKMCGGCKEKNTLLSLNEREWVCPTCGEKHDRDINAANNIKAEGFKQYISI